MRALLMSAAAAASVTLALAGCGSSGPKVPRGNPDARVGPQAVDSYAQVEILRAQLIASSDSYYAGGSADDARAQLERATGAYDQLVGRVRAADPVLAREVGARFALVTAAIRRSAPADHYRDIVGPLSDQLMDGVSQALVAPAKRADPGVAAEALRRVTLRMSADYDASAASQGDPDGRLAFEESWGLFRRAQALVAILGGKLGSEQGPISNLLGGLRVAAFPNGPLAPDQPQTSKVDTASTRIASDLEKRFALSA